MGVFDNFYSITQSTPLATLLTALTGAGITVVPGSGSLIGDPRAFGLLVNPPVITDPLLSFVDSAVGTPNGIPNPHLGATVLVLSTGQAVTMAGPNNSPSSGTDFGRPGDSLLAALIGTVVGDTYDAAILTLQFTTTGTSIHLPYLFGSEEYNEFVYSVYTDVMAIWLDGVNLAVVPGTPTPIAINTVHDGDPVGTPPFSHPIYYTNNDGLFPDPVYSQLDGFVGLNAAGSVPMSITATVVPGRVYTLRIGICDVADGVYDSVLFLGQLTGCGVPGIGYSTVLPGTFGGTTPAGTPGNPPGGSPPSAIGCLDSHTIPPWNGGPPGPPGIPGAATTFPTPPVTYGDC